MSVNTKEFEIVVFGARSFVDKILCNYLCNQYREPNLRWAMAARSSAKLAELKAELGENAKAIPLIVADSADAESLAQLCDRTELVISTVGPYALYGELLIEACVRGGVDYCDLTGEPQWIRRMVDRNEALAQQSGARIVQKRLLYLSVPSGTMSTSRFRRRTSVKCLASRANGSGLGSSIDDEAAAASPLAAAWFWLWLWLLVFIAGAWTPARKTVHVACLVSAPSVMSCTRSAAPLRTASTMHGIGRPFIAGRSEFGSNDVGGCRTDKAISVGSLVQRPSGPRKSAMPLSVLSVAAADPAAAKRACSAGSSCSMPSPIVHGRCSRAATGGRRRRSRCSVAVARSIPASVSRATS